jgi:two-component system sensor histidine kinase UhpB
VFAWTRSRERFQLDELPGTLLFLALALVWFAWRRIGEFGAELGQRRAVERKLAAALASNRRLARDNVRIQEEERRMLARELHDELGQYLNAIKVDAVCIRDAGARDVNQVRRDALSIIDSADHVQATVRDVMRRLRPPGLDELGLAAALESCVDGWRRRLPSVRFDLIAPESAPDWGEAVNMALYRIAQEGLTNVSKHAQATQVEIRLDEPTTVSGEPCVVLRVSDNGVGVREAAGHGGLGLLGMRERLETLGGRLDVSGPSSTGFTLVATLPLKAHTQ